MPDSSQSEPVRERRPLTPWELPLLLTPAYRFRPTVAATPHERPHFPAIVAFVHESRFALASQVRRRFPIALRSDRTARRHLVEAEALGYLAVVTTRSTGPLWPKVYGTTPRGLRWLQGTLAGKAIPVTGTDALLNREYSADRVLHEILVTEFLLNVWQAVQGRTDLELLSMERRALPRHPAFRVTVDGQASRLIPDALFLFRQHGAASVCCFVEMDLGTMSMRQMQEKFARYEIWARSERGQRYLTELYRRHEADDPRPRFRILVITMEKNGTQDVRRLLALCAVACHFPRSVRERLWFTTVADLRAHQHDPQPLNAAIWRRASDIRTGVGDDRTPHGRESTRSRQEMRRVRSLVAEQLAEVRPHPLFPLPPSEPASSTLHSWLRSDRTSAAGVRRKSTGRCGRTSARRGRGSYLMTCTGPRSGTFPRSQRPSRRLPGRQLRRFPRGLSRPGNKCVLGNAAGRGRPSCARSGATFSSHIPVPCRTTSAVPCASTSASFHRSSPPPVFARRSDAGNRTEGSYVPCMSRVVARTHGADREGYTPSRRAPGPRDGQPSVAGSRERHG